MITEMNGSADCKVILFLVYFFSAHKIIQICAPPFSIYVVVLDWSNRQFIEIQFPT